MPTKAETLLSAVTSTGAGSWINVANSRGVIVTHTASSSPDLTVAIEGKDHAGNAVALDSTAISAAGDTLIQVPIGFSEIRANVTVYTAGTLSSFLNAA
jgi:hypothetical protein